MKILKWLNSNMLFVLTLFLLAFIPLYPKLPLLDIKNTWVYVRIEDFLVVAGMVIWFIQLLRRKITFKTPLTIPILLFWFVGAASTLYAVIFVFPGLRDVFPNVAILHILRRIEYLSVFFIAYTAITDKKQIKHIVLVLLITLVAVCLYGYGQRGLIVGFDNRFPAFSTMNEEFAKGEPLYISLANRVQSTFAGHYDLAAYLVMVIPIMGSLVFGAKKWWSKIVFFIAAVMGLFLLMMTASRVSFGVYLMTIIFMLIIQRQKKWIIPVVVFSVVLLNFNQTLSQRLRDTVTEVDVAVNSKTNETIRVEKEGNTYVIKEPENNGEGVNPSQTGVISVPVEQKEGDTTKKIEIKKRKIVRGEEITEVTSLEGDFIIKKAYAVDASFAIRFQGQWPRAIEAFKKNILFGSGYSTINLATDNNYLRILGEIGVLGLSSYLLIFIIFIIYVYRVLPEVDNKLTRGFVLGVLAGIFGLALNAILIDVFEASKVAFVLWMVIGVTTGILSLYRKKQIHYIKDLQRIFTSLPALLLYLLAAAFGIFSMMFPNYFVADDFTWLRWIAECPKALQPDGTLNCAPEKAVLIDYFTSANGFFYRPGMKLFFHFMYKFAWLNPTIYHIASLLLHYAVTGGILLLSAKILKNKFYALMIAFMFLILGSHAETIFWVSSVGHLLASACIILALVSHMYWIETKRKILFLLTVLSIIAAPLFHELGVVAPFMVIIYDVIIQHKGLFNHLKKRWYYLAYLLPLPAYMFVRGLANSHWTGGDYSYNLAKLPFNIIGNIFGYAGLVLIGSKFYPFYSMIRNTFRDNIALAAVICLIILAVAFVLYRFVFRSMKGKEVHTLTLALSLFILPLLPFAGLGNIAERYVYLASFGLLLFIVYLLMKLGDALEKVARFAGYSVMIAITLLFSYYQYGELQRVNDDYRNAGELTNNLLINFNYAFAISKATPPNPVFYFVDVPIRKGDAWVFPVGLPDALWFTFQKDNLTVHTMKDLELALDAAEGSSSARVFQFDNNGEVEEVTRTTTEVPVEK